MKFSEFKFKNESELNVRLELIYKVEILKYVESVV